MIRNHYSILMIFVAAIGFNWSCSQSNRNIPLSDVIKTNSCWQWFSGASYGDFITCFSEGHQSTHYSRISDSLSWYQIGISPDMRGINEWTIDDLNKIIYTGKNVLLVDSVSVELDTLFGKDKANGRLVFFVRNERVKVLQSKMLKVDF